VGVVQHLLFKSQSLDQAALELKKCKLSFTFQGKELGDAWDAMRASMPDDLRVWHELGTRRTRTPPEDSAMLWVLQHELLPFYRHYIHPPKDKTELNPNFQHAWDLFESKAARILVEALVLSDHLHEDIINIVTQLKVPIDVGTLDVYLTHYFNTVGFLPDDLDAYVDRIEALAGSNVGFSKEADCKRYALTNPFQTFPVVYRAGYLLQMSKELAVESIRHISFARAQMYARREITQAELDYLDKTAEGFRDMGTLVNRSARNEMIMAIGGTSNLSDFATLFLESTKGQLINRSDEIAKGTYSPRGAAKLALPSEVKKPGGKDN
jgi:hypothetical protein